MRRLLILLYILLLISPLAHAQKVALVLSGGGSKGVSHIGVLKALEEEGIPINYIAGTSMGAIIGGLYAAGYSPAEMEEMLMSPDFAKWVSGKIDPQYFYYSKQPEADASWISFKFRYDSTFQTQLPTNIISPVRMDYAFMEIFAGATAAAGNDFDSLMIPFRCVAADIAENRPYVMRRGDLASSIRASMTFPFYFKPLRIDGKLLFDGGMYNNFPANVAYDEFYPDIIVGSKAASGYAPPEEGNILSQIENMLMVKTDFDVICANSVLIEPQLEAVNVIDFSKTRAFIDSGYLAAKRIIPRIRQFVTDTITTDERVAQREAFNNRKPEPIITGFNITGINSRQSAYINNMLTGNRIFKLNRTNTAMRSTFNEVRDSYFKVLAEGRIDAAYPRLKYNQETKGYELEVETKREKLFTADFGGSISSRSTNQIFLQLKYNYWQHIAITPYLNIYIGQFYNSLKTGMRMEIPGLIPISSEGSYTMNQFKYYRTKTSFFFDEKTPSFLQSREVFGDLKIGFPLTYKGRMIFGFTLGENIDNYYQTSTFTRNDTLDESSLNFISPYISIDINTLNRKLYPDQGMQFLAETRFISGGEHHEAGSTSVQIGTFYRYHNYLQAHLLFQKYKKYTRFYSLGFMLEAMVNGLKPYRNYTATSLAAPAFAPLPEMKVLYQPQFRNPVYAAFGLQQVFSPLKNFDIRLEGYLMAPYRDLLQNEDFTASFGDPFETLHYVASGSAVYSSPIGPVSVSLNYYHGDDKPFSFFVNIGYLLFNRSSLR
jgi:NTE family protein